MATPLTRVELDATGCSNPGCDHDHTVLFFHPRCHPHRGLIVSYDKRTGLISMKCRVCKRPLRDIAVAARGSEMAAL
jgi:hypothetical protein